MKFDARLLPGKPWKDARTPFELAGGTRISLPEIGTQICEASSKDKDGADQVYLDFVFASGRSPNCLGQIGLVCDALFTPEISLSLGHRCTGLTKRLVVRSRLDIDVQEIVRDYGGIPTWLERPHMVLCATGDINSITANVIAHYQSSKCPLRPGQTAPHSAEFMGCEGSIRYSAPVLPHGAFLVAARSPWWGDRIVIICGGILGIGTVGALWMLNEYIAGRGASWGNNRLQPTVPGKIIDVRAAKYANIELRDHRDLIPQQDIRNIAMSAPVSILE